MQLQTSRRSWLCALVLAVFDLDTGQKTESCIPEARLSREEQQCIAYGAFPESKAYASDARNGISDTSYAFRIRRSAGVHPGKHPQYLYCFVCARQCRDDRLHRGADQRSVVIVSELPYSSILGPLTAVLGPALFACFQSAAAEVMHACTHLWPPPVPGRLTHLTVGPHRVIGRVPLDACLPESDLHHRPAPAVPDPSASPPAACLPLCGAFCEPLDVLELLLVHSKQLWKLWEVMLLAQPMMVFSCSAAHSSAAVCALVSLISPLPYSADFRPLLSIHDPAAQLLQEGKEHTPGHPVPTAVGVTNPYFLRAFQHCPNVMTIMHEPSALAPLTDVPELPPLSHATSGGGMLTNLFTTSGSFHPDLLAGKLDSLSLQQGLLCVGQDRGLLARIKAAADAPSLDTVVAACHMLRSHFHHLTAAFLLPFFDYFRRPCPWVAHHQVPTAKPSHGLDKFDAKGFNHFLEGYTISEVVVGIAGNKRKAQALYNAFIASINFQPWLTRMLSESG